MKKRDVLKILTVGEIANLIERHPAQVSRMPKDIPESLESKIITACKNKISRLNTTLNKLTESKK